MAFSDLYQAVQNLKHGPKVSTRALRDLAIKFSSITLIKEQWSGHLDGAAMRGFYVEGPIGPPIPLKEKQALIALSRSNCTGQNGDQWRRLIFTKELMHVFDSDEEIADSREKFDVQIQKLSDPMKPTSPQYRAEQKAMWRALAVLCSETNRQRFILELAEKKTEISTIAEIIGVPETYITPLLRRDFRDIIDGMMK